MAAKQLPSQEVLRQLLRYEPETGKLFWLSRPASSFAETTRSAVGTASCWNAKNAHQQAFTYISDDGYARGKIFHSLFAAHRIIFKMAYNQEPVNVDHINRDRADNRLSNLRAALLWQNSANTSDKKRSTSQFRGVYKHPKSSSWRASIRDPNQKKRIHIGSFATETAAAQAYDEFASRLYGEFAVINLSALEASHD